MSHVNISRTTLAALYVTLTLSVATAATSSHRAQSHFAAQASTLCTQISQYGVTFTLGRAYACGQFANGDYWVAPDSPPDTVTITDISPEFTGTTNGWQVNPTDVVTQGFDGRPYPIVTLAAASFDASLVPALPYVAHGGQSIVKAVSPPDNSREPLQIAVVLTVLASIPDGNGATFLRPPYFGLDKPLRSINDIHLEKLPQLAPPTDASVPTLASLQLRFQPVQLDHQTDWDGENIHPVDNLPIYGSSVAIDNTVAVLRLMLNDTAQDKLPLAIAVVQYAIDVAAARSGGKSVVRPRLSRPSAGLAADAGAAMRVEQL